MNARAFPTPSAEPTIRDLIEAIGGLAVVFTAHLDRAGIASADEIAEHLGLFATVTAETSPMPGAILAYWTDVIGETSAA